MIQQFTVPGFSPVALTPYKDEEGKTRYTRSPETSVLREMADVMHSNKIAGKDILNRPANTSAGDTGFTLP